MGEEKICIWRPIRDKEEEKIKEGKEPMLNDNYSKRCYICEGTEKCAKKLGCPQYQIIGDLEKKKESKHLW